MYFCCWGALNNRVGRGAFTNGDKCRKTLATLHKNRCFSETFRTGPRRESFATPKLQSVQLRVNPKRLATFRCLIPTS